MMASRWVTAGLLIPLIFTAIFVLPTGGWAFFSLILVLLASWEWAKFNRLVHPGMRFFWVILNGLLCLILWKTASLILTATWILVTITWFSTIFWLWCLLQRGQIPPMLIMSGGIIILPVTWLQFLHLHQSPWQLLSLIMIAVATDTGAYIIGKRWGHHQLMPRISPQKTWEGLCGGLSCALLAGLLILPWFPDSSSQRWDIWYQIPALLLLSACCMYGDAIESALKRNSGLKDSGHLLPGHGGILDRIDSLLPQLPCYLWLCGGI